MHYYPAGHQKGAPDWSLSVCLCICTYDLCKDLCHVHCCHVTLLLSTWWQLEYWYSYYLAQLWVWDAEKQRQHKHKAGQERKHQKRAAIHDGYGAANQLRIASRRALGRFEDLAGPKITLRFPHMLVYMCVRTYHMCNNYVTYIVAMRPNFSQLQQFRRLPCVATMSSLPQLRVWDGYWEAEAT